jgi:hypothetical protein
LILKAHQAPLKSTYAAHRPQKAAPEYQLGERKTHAAEPKRDLCILLIMQLIVQWIRNAAEFVFFSSHRTMANNKKAAQMFIAARAEFKEMAGKNMSVTKNIIIES